MAADSERETFKGCLPGWLGDASTLRFFDRRRDVDRVLTFVEYRGEFLFNSVYTYT